MEIYNRLKDLLGDVLPYHNQKNILNTIIKYTGYSDDFKEIVLSNPELSLRILQRYEKITNNFIQDDKTLEQLLDFAAKQLIVKDDKEEKKLFIQINNQIYDFLTKENFFQKCYDEKGICNVEVSKQDVINYKKENPLDIANKTNFELRKNQLEVKKHLETNGLVTGIHCESTGCGKSIEILMYIDFAHKLNPNCKIVLFTERVNILADLFDFEKKTNPIDIKNIKVWKDKGICDLTGFEIIDRVTVKKSDWVQLLNKSTKPTLLVINRAYLTMTKEYEKLSQLDLILHDECHNVSSNKCFDFLKYFKSKEIVKSIINVSNHQDNDSSSKLSKSGKKIYKTYSSKISEVDKLKLSSNNTVPIVGFSATPLRAGKTKSGDETVYNKDRLVEIYGLGGQLNLITNYNMVYAISEKLILPPKFYWFNIDNYLTKGKYDKDKDKDKDKNKDDKKKPNKKDKKEGQVSKSELGSVMKILDELIPLMPNKKLVAWCGTIPLCDEWYVKFYEHKDMYENLKNMKIYKDYSKKIDDLDVAGYETFKHIDGEGIMFCAQKHREGSDIKKLDGCIFLDKVKSRGAIPFIQSIGRVLRIDPTNLLKTSGFVIDGVVRDDEDYEKNIVDKILGYYFALADLADLASLDEIVSNSNKTNESNYNKYVKLRDLVVFVPEEKKIKLKLDKVWIEINCKKLDWMNIVKNFDTILERKVGLSQDEILKAEFERLKKTVKEKNFLTINEYYKWAKKKNLEENPKIKYNKFWTNTFDFLGIDTSNYINKNKFKKICIKFDIKNVNDLEKINKIYDVIPYDPCEYYGIKNFKDFMGIGDILIN